MSKKYFEWGKMTKNRFQKGFSVIELLFSLSILSIMLLIVVPRGMVFIEKTRALTYADELRAALQFARSSAISLGERVIFCGSREHKVCDGSWREGQIVVTDSGRVLRVLAKIFGDDRLIWQGSAMAKDQITFLPNGVPNGQRGHFCYGSQGNLENVSVVILETTGRVRISERIHDGKIISCNF